MDLPLFEKPLEAHSNQIDGSLSSESNAKKLLITAVSVTEIDRLINVACGAEVILRLTQIECPITEQPPFDILIESSSEFGLRLIALSNSGIEILE